MPFSSIRRVASGSYDIGYMALVKQPNGLYHNVWTSVLSDIPTSERAATELKRINREFYESTKKVKNDLSLLDRRNPRG